MAKNKGLAIGVLVTLIAATALTTAMIFNGSNIKNDAWFLPVLFAEIWVISSYILTKTY